MALFFFILTELLILFVEIIKKLFFILEFIGIISLKLLFVILCTLNKSCKKLQM